MLISIVFIISGAAGLVFHYATQFDSEVLSPFQIIIKNQVVVKWEQAVKAQPESKWALTSLDYLMDALSWWERAFVWALFKQDPAHYGFKGAKVVVRSVPELIELSDQQYDFAGEAVTISSQYIARPMLEDLQALQAHMKQDLGRTVLVLSGWRSDGYQAYLFLLSLKSLNNSLQQTLREVSFPGYSEHANSQQPAVDWLTESGQGGTDLLQTEEFFWLQQWGNQYNFHLSYPAETPDHAFEPGHWHWKRMTE